jgi:hypothetical protein
MIRSVLSITLVTAMASLSSASPELTAGENMPELRGEYLSGRKAVLPGDASGRVALLLFGFTYQSRFAVEAWAKRFRGDFERNTQVTFYEIPMIGGIARLGKWFIDSGMRRGTPNADYENVITVYGGIEPWKQRLAVKAEDSAYLVVLDRKGNVAWCHTGPFEETSYQGLAAQVRKLASAQ